MTPTRALLTSASTRAVLQALTHAGDVTVRELADLTGSTGNITTQMTRFARRGYVTQAGTRTVTARGGGLYPSAVWRITEAGRDALAIHDQDEPEAVLALARVRGWLVKAARADMTAEGRRVCVLEALDEISAAAHATGAAA